MGLPDIRCRRRLDHDDRGAIASAEAHHGGRVLVFVAGVDPQSQSPRRSSWRRSRPGPWSGPRRSSHGGRGWNRNRGGPAPAERCGRPASGGRSRRSRGQAPSHGAGCPGHPARLSGMLRDGPGSSMASPHARSSLPGGGGCIPARAGCRTAPPVPCTRDEAATWWAGRVLGVPRTACGWMRGDARASDRRGRGIPSRERPAQRPGWPPACPAVPARRPPWIRSCPWACGSHPLEDADFL